MKKYLIFLLLLLFSVGVKAVTIDLTFGTRTKAEPNDENSQWYWQDVTDAKSKLKVGDIIVVSYGEVKTADDCQYAICNEHGAKIYTNGADVVNGEIKDYYTCPVGDKDFTFTIDQTLYNAIQSGGLQIQEKGLNVDGKMTIMVSRIAENWGQYKPNNATEIMSTPRYIKDWYNDGYVLKTSTDYLNKTLRVVCLETGDDSYAFLKKNDAKWSSLMSGSDKFSIAGWKYFEIQINQKLNDLLKGEGLRIGGNNYYIAGIYVYDSSGKTAPEWTEENSDVIDTYTFSTALDGNAKEWDGAKIPGKFFEFQGQGNQISTTKLANTKNNIIRFVFDGTAGKGAQVSAKDANPSSTSSSDDVLKDANGNYASYIRQRKYDTTKGSFYYVDYADCQGANHFDFELSDAITLFKAYNQPVVDNDDHAPGVKKGMLSTLLQNGMVIGVNKVKVTAVQIRKSMVSKYVTGYAEYYHPLSDKVWRPIALPYNLTRQQVEDAFGENVLVCDLGDSYVSKKKVTEGGVAHYEYGITFSFENVKVANNDKNAAYLNADYPYIIKLKDKGSANTSTFTYDESKGGYQGTYIFKNVKADVRDFQSYEFRTGEFSFGRTGEGVSDDEKFMNPDVEPTDAKEKQTWDFEQQIRNDVGGAYMIFQSTAPVFNISNTGVGEVEIINDVNLYTPFAWTDEHYYNYYFSEGKLWPGNKFDTNCGVKSGLAYVRFPAATYSLFEGQNQVTPTNVSLAKFSCIFPGDDNTTGVEEIVAQPKRQNVLGVYSLGGQLIRKGTTIDGLAKGIYIVNGKKVIVNQ